MKDKAVLAVGLVVILIIASLVIYGNNQCSDNESIAVEAMNGVLLQQKDIIIVKLMRQVREKQLQVDGLKADLEIANNKLNANKAEFEDAKRRLENIKTEITAPMATPEEKK